MNTEMLREVALYQDVTLNINYQIGKEVGNYIVTMLQGKGKIAEIRGLEGSTPALERHNDA